eukprot:5521436-Pleurochrysis_carterae.AAC.1
MRYVNYVGGGSIWQAVNTSGKRPHRVTIMQVSYEINAPTLGAILAQNADLLAYEALRIVKRQQETQPPTA